MVRETLKQFHGENNCLMENQAEAAHGQASRPVPGWATPPHCRFPPAAAQPLPPPSAGPWGATQPRPPGRPARPAPPRSYPGAAASAAVHTQTRWAAVRSRGPRISAACGWATNGSWGNSREPWGVAFHLLPDFFPPDSGV